MKKARKKRIVRRKRRFSEREVMRIKRKLKKSARKLRLGAKRTGAYVYGTLRRIVGNPGNPVKVVIEEVARIALEDDETRSYVTRELNLGRKQASRAYRMVAGLAEGKKVSIDPESRIVIEEVARIALEDDETRGYVARELGIGRKEVSDAYRYVSRKLRGNPGGLKILGYRSGMQYLTDGKDVYRRAKMDMKHGGMRWYSTYASFPASIRAYGPLTSPRGLRGNPSFASLHPRDRATADKFVDYVYGFYGKGGLYAGDFGNRGFTRREIERAVAIYIDQIRKKKTEWGGGDSIDRERVRKILQPSYSFA